MPPRRCRALKLAEAAERRRGRRRRRAGWKRARAAPRGLLRERGGDARDARKVLVDAPLRGEQPPALGRSGLGSEAG